MLFVSPEFPLPAHSGGCLRTLSLLQGLAADFDVHCVTFAQAIPGPKELAALRALVKEVTVLPLGAHGQTPLHRYGRNIRRALRLVPPLVDRFSEPQIRRALMPLLGDSADCVWLEHLWLAPYVAMALRAKQKILDVHNVESDFYHQLRHFSPHPLAQLGYYVFERAARRIEQRHLAAFDRILAVSPEDRELLARNCPPERIFVVPNAVKLASCVARVDEPGSTLYFAGRLDYAPNREAVSWFYHQVWPLIRRTLSEVKWTIVGGYPELLEAEIRHDPQVTLTGRVEKTEPYLYPTSLVIVPLTIGGGSRFKILEAWSAGKAVVSTPKGAWGLAAVHGENIWIAGNPAEFADAVVRLLSDSNLRARLGTGGRGTAENRYSWERVKESLEAALLSS